MITIRNSEIVSNIRNGEATVEMIEKYLMENHPITDIVRSLAEYLKDDSGYKPIIISQQQFEKHFRLTGIRSDGSQETRGRKPNM